MIFVVFGCKGNKKKPKTGLFRVIILRYSHENDPYNEKKRSEQPFRPHVINLFLRFKELLPSLFSRTVLEQHSNNYLRFFNFSSNLLITSSSGIKVLENKYLLLTISSYLECLETVDSDSPMRYAHSLMLLNHLIFFNSLR